MFEIKKTDGRFKSHALYKYQAKPVHLGYRHFHKAEEIHLLNFIKARNWCIDQWGKSCEMNVSLGLIRHASDMINSHWAWEIEYAPGQYDPKFRIYFKDQEEASYFALVWANGSSDDQD
jgi:hypothetical protein